MILCEIVHFTEYRDQYDQRLVAHRSPPINIFGGLIDIFSRADDLTRAQLAHALQVVGVNLAAVPM
jgi:hypothetical protein